MPVAHRRHAGRLSLAATVVALAVALSACGGRSTSATPALAASPTAVPPLKIVTPTPAGAAPAATAPPAQPAAPAPATVAASGGYVVQSGDTLYGIAARFGVSQETLMQANGISDPTQIHVGQQLVIPGKTP
jgi:membrane-bound lytic murein transglycosylase D